MHAQTPAQKPALRTVTPLKKISIPDISDERLSELYRRIKPLVRFGSELRHIQPVNLRNGYFTWSPRPTKNAGQMRQVCEIETYHTALCTDRFTPTIAEVLAQIPERYIKQVIAFHIAKFPQTPADFAKHADAFNAGFHVATTRLFASTGHR